MSKNNQVLIKEHKGKFYVFDIMAESWGNFDEEGKLISDTNMLHVDEALNYFPTREKAYKFAKKYEAADDFGGSEYGIVNEILCKDGASVEIIE